MSKKEYNLFIYGSLRDRRIFQSVCGFNVTRKPSKADEDTLLAEPAILPYHRKVSPDNVYYYAIASPSSSIEGFVIHDLPASALAEIDRYEGKRYTREAVTVNTAKGRIKAQAYLVSHETMKKHFGDRFHVNLIHELWLRKRIKKFLDKHTRPGDKTADAEFERLAERELLATTERDLVITHYRADAVSDYYLEHELDRPHPSIKNLYNDPDAVKFIERYLILVLKQVLLNQLDEKIQSRYRFELEHIRTSERYFKRSVSLLIALQMMNDNSDAVDMITEKCLQTMPYDKNDLFDYVKYAVRAAASIFDSRVVESHLERIHSRFRPGMVPLGCELELSNLGAATVEPLLSIQKKGDPVYAGFRYFYDFALHILGWKLGAYIDDHSGSTDTARRIGFLELAPGRLNIAGELSRPATAAPWLLNQLIHAITQFYDIQPHSLHLSFQMRKKQIGRQKVLPLGFVKCLLALGGGLKEKETGGLWISRMGQDEIKQYSYGEELVFARTSKRKWYIGTDEIAARPPAQATTQVQQYKFIRLEKRANYEPLIMCLKGLQLGYNPADYLTAEQLKASKKLREEYEELKKWSLAPTPLSTRTINKFLKVVEQGLMNEGHFRPAHELHYIDWALTSIDVQLQMFNKQVANLQTVP
jgi:gamma-glutamylcyclotransferase (GGCT)/AIG2-like uncharacterized protein YtfP